MNYCKCGENTQAVRKNWLLKWLIVSKLKNNSYSCITHCANMHQTAASYIQLEIFTTHGNQNPLPLFWCFTINTYIN
jgi:hypothetical protein